MRIVLERRSEPSLAMALLSPALAIALTLAASAALFAALGKDPLAAMHAYFVAPLTDPWSLRELVVKATPLVMIGVGLCVCYLSNNWNIGAEGQYVMGGICGAWAALLFHKTGSPLGLPAVIAMGAAGGMALALVPAILKVRLSTNEILTSLMLVYIAELLLDYLVRGPWRDPRALNFPQSVAFDVWVPVLVEGSRIHVGAALALVFALVGAFVLRGTLKGLEIRVLGQAPRAAVPYARRCWCSRCRARWRGWLARSKWSERWVSSGPRFRRATASPPSSWPSWAVSIRWVPCSRVCCLPCPISAARTRRS
jgi:simple sugar transport system permease protein